MATLTKAINKSLFDSILPTYGSPRVHFPTWDNSQKMFICDEYESNKGHRHYIGIRFCDRIVIVEKVGLYHSWTYIDSTADLEFMPGDSVLATSDNFTADVYDVMYYMLGFYDLK